MFNVLSALTGFRPRLSQEILCIAKLMTANSSAECPTPHMRRICSMAHIPQHMQHSLFTFVLARWKTSLANDFAVVRLETKEGPFYYRNISGEKIKFFITVFNKFQKLAAGENYSHYSFILIPKQ